MCSQELKNALRRYIVLSATAGHRGSIVLIIVYFRPISREWIIFAYAASCLVMIHYSSADPSDASSHLLGEVLVS